MDQLIPRRSEKPNPHPIEAFFGLTMPLDVLKKQSGARADLRGIMVMAVMAVTVAMPLRLAKTNIRKTGFWQPAY